MREAPSIRAATGPHVVVSLNVSPELVERPGFARELQGMLRIASLEPSALMLEIRERPRIADLEAAVDEMRQLHLMGVRLAADNLGEGFASLQYVRRLPLDVVKLPRSIVARVGDDREAAAILSAMLTLASSLGLEAIATGVETAAQAEALRVMGCRLMQGPMFPDASRPGPAPADLPTSIEPVLGWRVWRLLDDDHDVRLGSMTRPDLWPQGEPFRATCPTPTAHGPRVPAESCSCGIYAASTPEDLAHAGVLGVSASVVGAIAMWGTVVEHDRGARAELAYPSRLRLACATCLNEGRGVVDPSVVVGWGSTPVAFCVRHAIGRAGPRKRAAEVQAALLSGYAVEVMPRERVASQLKVPSAGRARRDAQDLVETIAQGVFMVIGVVVNVVMAIWVLSVVLFLAYRIIAAIVGLFLPEE